MKMKTSKDEGNVKKSSAGNYQIATFYLRAGRKLVAFTGGRARRQ